MRRFRGPARPANRHKPAAGGSERSEALPSQQPAKGSLAPGAVRLQGEVYRGREMPCKASRVTPGGPPPPRYHPEFGPDGILVAPNGAQVRANPNVDRVLIREKTSAGWKFYPHGQQPDHDSGE